MLIITLSIVASQCCLHYHCGIAGGLKRPKRQYISRESKMLLWWFPAFITIWLIFCRPQPGLTVRTRLAPAPLRSRAIRSYEYFARHPELGLYLLRADDDTHISVSNLMRLVTVLDMIYDAAREFVFRGAAAAWLCSRPLVALIVRTGESPIEATRRIFERTKTWSDPLFCEHCDNCNGSAFRAGDFSALADCPDGETWPMNSIVAYRTADRGDRERIDAGRMIGRYPPDVHFYRRGGDGGSVVCRKREWRGYREWENFSVEHIDSEAEESRAVWGAILERVVRRQNGTVKVANGKSRMKLLQRP
jgi:hypothetical protein